MRGNLNGALLATQAGCAGIVVGDAGAGHPTISAPVRRRDGR
jgi:hypothetical protein